MLKELSLRNYLLLEDLHLEFSPGFNVITGETGSGKSVLLEGLRILLGQSVSREDLRDPEKKAYFELVYEDDKDILALSREIFPSGRSLSRINGELVNLNTVRETFGPLVDFYGQRDDSLLLHGANQQKLLFDYAGDEVSKLLEEISEYKRSYEAASQELSITRDLSALEKEALEAQLKELTRLDIRLEEDRSLEEGFDEILHSREILLGLEASLGLIDDGALPSLYQLEDRISSLEHYGKQEELLDRLKNINYELEDIRDQIRDSLYSLDIDESLLIEKENRFLELSEARKKYQRNLEEILEYRAHIEKILDRDKRQDELRKELIREQKAAFKKYLKVSDELVELSKRVFKKMSEELRAVLSFLELPDSSFELKVEKRSEDYPFSQGHYRMSFLTSMNRGPLRPMASVLSGGEMSRLMLALKSISKGREIMIFDEIDSGISGKVAHQVASQIKGLSKNRQVIAISHLPQVLAFSDEHFHLEKSQGTSRALKLDSRAHQEKLAIMMSGQLNESSFETAGKMIERARGEIK